jgi:hypothetical protein
VKGNDFYMILAILPPYNYYTNLTITANKIAVRQFSQIHKKIRQKYEYILFDDYIPQQLAQHYNKVSVSESLNHAITQEGIDYTEYKKISLADLNFVEAIQASFIPCYRDALAFISIIKEVNPSKIIISTDDPSIDIFKEISEQMGIQITFYPLFGKIDIDKTRLIKKSYNKVRDVNYHAPLKETKLIKIIITKLINTWSKFIRIIRGRKPFIGFAFYNPLNPVKSMLLFQKSYYPVLFRFTRLNLKDVLFSGVYIFPMRDLHAKNYEFDKILENYKKHLLGLKQTKSIGQIEFVEQKLSIANSITDRLLKIAPVAFKQLVDNIDILESFIKINNFKGFLSFCDSPWNERLIVRLCQKYKLNNVVIMNGWLGDEFQCEAKTATKILCYGDSYLKNYFKEREDVVVIGNPLFEQAYKKRCSIKPKFPPQRIIVGSFSFSPIDINCHYSDNEKFLMDVFDVLKQFKNEQKFKFETLLKIHPADYPEFYQWFLKENGYSEVKIISHGNFQKLVAGFDLLIINNSTGLFETALMGIPVIFYHPVNQILFEPFDGFESLPTAFNRDELANVLKRCFQDEGYAHSFNDIQVLKPFTGSVDGKAGERIISCLIN